ncbi:ComEC/Rec2 family competence protein [Alkalinema pantanalense CENA528]|uniref:ComEC/Rec2 family competence protein n=1 Tax=Alkalinema pantanalense TaxID=1620705 RepID=UPI003D6E6AB2
MSGMAFICLAYILGLLAMAIPWGIAIGPVLLGLAAITYPTWRSRVKFPSLSRKHLIVAGCVALLASLWYQFRIPQPGTHDISRFVPALTDRSVAVQGIVQSSPRLTRSDRRQIWLQVQRLDPKGLQLSTDPSQARGKLYVTVAANLGQDLFPGEQITLTGKLYLPQAAKNPGAFDFQQYLAQEGSFAGLRGESIQIPPGQQPKWGLWQIRQRIVRSQTAWLPKPEGELVSAMVLGGKAVDLPTTVKEDFRRAGLSHALAASGFQTSLILGVVLALTQRFSVRTQVIAGGLALAIFLGLAGVQPAILRAVVMGAAVLVGMGLERQVKPIGSLLLSATLLLLINPLWIWDLGFQLSVLATLGLLVTVPPLTKWLDWIPSQITPAIAVPISAYLWTIPLQLHTFGLVSPYSILANVLTTIFISIISLGGMVSALCAVVYPLAGSATAWLLHYPVLALLAIVHGFSQLPGNNIAVGTVPLVLMLALYGTIALLWLRPSLRRHGWAFFLAGLAMIFLPAWQYQAQLTQVTALATSPQAVLVVQDRGKVLLVNSGDAATAEMTVVPYLQSQGINQIDWAIALQKPDPNGWAALRKNIAVRNLYVEPAMVSTIAPTITKQLQKTQLLPLAANSHYTFGQMGMQSQAAGLTLMIRDQPWLLSRSLAKAAPQSTAKSSSPSPVLDPLVIPPASQPRQPILWWSGGAIPDTWLQQWNLQAAIAHGKRLHPQVEYTLKTQKVRLHWLPQQGALRWQPDTGLVTTFSTDRTEWASL